MSLFRSTILAGMLTFGWMCLAVGDARAQFPGYPPYPYPPYPIYQSPTTVTGIGPGGGINTAGSTVYHSALDPFRNSSAGNGTLRQVNRPVQDAAGNNIGWEVGVEWINSVTGQVHKNTRIITQNGLGGVNSGWHQQNVQEFQRTGGFRPGSSGPSATRPHGFTPRR